jgi:hypothetical protein
MLMPVRLIVSHTQEPCWYFMIAVFYLAHIPIASLGIIPPTDVNQIEKETLKGGLRC